MKRGFLIVATLLVLKSSAQDSASVPFSGMDLTWINGQTRETDNPLQLVDKQSGETILTGMVFVDGYYNFDFTRPIDNTHVVSATIGRSNEFCLNLAGFGIESYYKHMIARLSLQFGEMLAIAQDEDMSVAHGRNTSIADLKYIREGAAGYHFDKWHGINVELGLFNSYIGVESYFMNENWSYQRSYVSDLTPFYFTGARIQAFPAKNVKSELWLMNGWASFDSYNNSPGLGSANLWRPSENLQLAANFYVIGSDTRDKPGVLRFHHDHSVVYRYLHRKESHGITQAAFSLNNHYGFQSGDGVLASQQYARGTALSHRVWFHHDKMAITLRGDYITNPGLYMSLNPSPVTPNDFTAAIAGVQNQQLSLGQGTFTFDIMPSQHFTFRLEYGYRRANVPYFAGHGGTTSPDGWVDTPTSTWKPELQKDEHRVTLVMSVRI
ncbi:MAG: porin [Taibaiella sp.]|nr:porin [Taibaiella sp.]